MTILKFIAAIFVGILIVFGGILVGSIIAAFAKSDEEVRNL